MILYRQLYLSQVFLVLMMTIGMTQATVRESFFKEVGEGQSIIKKIGAELNSRSKLECAVRCLNDNQCIANKYRRNKAGDCLLIYKNSTEEEGQIIEQDSNSTIFEKEETTVSGKTGFPPDGWYGPDAALYYSFDSSDGFVLMEATQERGLVPIVTGQVNNAWTLNHTKSQWVDLGIQTEVCMTQPETCGTAGGAVSLWVNVIDCPGVNRSGIISSIDENLFSGSLINCWVEADINIGLWIYVTDGYFWASRVTSGWTHVVLNYIGPNDGQGIRMYLDGTEVASGTTKWPGSYPAGDGRIIVGRYFPDEDHHYASVQVDELIFFNQSLTQQEINALATAT